LAQYELICGIEVDPALKRFVEEEALPGTGIAAGDFWFGFSALLRDLAPENRRLLQIRGDLQARIDARDRDRGGRPPDPAEEEEFLREIDYLVDSPPPFEIGTEGVDPEIASISGPQLVVPLSNARYALNAANARWGSLYDALYGSDALGEPPPPGPYDPQRGARAIGWGRRFLDEIAPLTGGSHADAGSYRIESGGLATDRGGLADPSLLAGWREGAILLRHHGLLVEIVFDPDHPVGRDDPAAIADIRLESAITAIMDCEDSVACVDAEDKILVYRNWLGLMKGDLSAWLDKDGGKVERRLEPDLIYDRFGNGPLVPRRRALMLVRNVGHLMTNRMIRIDGADAPEGLADAAITALIALHDRNGPRANSPAGAIYIVKPKMHGPEEAAFAERLFARTEDLLGLARNTIKIGLMDEERRTSVNLEATIYALRERIAFINTGFLDRTGDEIHTSMQAGPMIRKSEMKSALWLQAYEDRNVDIGLACGFAGRGQIGKGMWAMPDLMADMLAQKIAHPMAGASTAWVPSPTAATLHAIHYHMVDVAARQRALSGRAPARLADLLTIPVAAAPAWSPAEIRDELDNNVQGILGYVVRWIDQGIGCSKVPDLRGIALMEDRATCRISSQHVANWLLHRIVTREEVEKSLERMAAIVDRQNESDPSYRPMGPDFAASIAFRAASDLVFEGAAQPSGYTEPLLHAHRLALKEQA
jgi:malate synthase